MHPLVAVDVLGNAMVIWTHAFGGARGVWSNRFDGAAGWQGTVPLDAGGLNEVEDLAMNARGDALALWMGAAVFANRYDYGAGWEGPSLAGPDLPAQGGRIALNAAGNAVVLWQSYAGGHWSVWGNDWRLGAGWGRAGPVEAPEVISRYPGIATDSMRIVGLWMRRMAGGSLETLWASEVGPSFGWGAPVQVASDDYVFHTHVAVGPGGPPMALWTEYVGSGSFELRFSRDVGGWEAPTTIDSIGELDGSDLAAGDSGRAFAMWSAGGRIHGAVFDPSIGWGPGVALDAGPGTFGTWWALGNLAAAGGRAFATWAESDGTRFRVWGNRYDGTNWTGRFVIDASTALNATYPRVAMNATGFAIVAWQQDQEIGHESVWAATLCP